MKYCLRGQMHHPRQGRSVNAIGVLITAEANYGGCRPPASGSAFFHSKTCNLLETASRISTIYEVATCSERMRNWPLEFLMTTRSKVCCQNQNGNVFKIKSQKVIFYLGASLKYYILENYLLFKINWKK